MAITAQSYVRVAPDSTGKKIRNVELVTVDEATGAENVVECQVVVLADPSGRLVSAGTAAVETILRGVAAELAAIRETLVEIGRPDTRHAIAKRSFRRREALR